MSDEDFWGLSTGESATETGQSYEAPGGSIEVIPDGSKVLALVENAEWRNTAQDGSGAEFLSLQWTVTKPEEVRNRKVFQKLFLTDLDPNAKDEAKAIRKRDTARRLFAAIDANAGGKLAKKGGKPDADAVMFALANKPMVIRLGVWSFTGSQGDKMEGNWVQAISPKASDIGLTAPKSKPAPTGGGYGGSAGGVTFDDDIPFAPEWRV